MNKINPQQDITTLINNQSVLNKKEKEFLISMTENMIHPHHLIGDEAYDGKIATFSIQSIERTKRN